MFKFSSNGCIAVSTESRIYHEHGGQQPFTHVLNAICTGSESSIQECSLEWTSAAMDTRCFSDRAVTCVPADSASIFLPSKNSICLSN